MCKTCTTFSARPSLQNDMDGGVAAALIEEEAEQRACPDLDAHWRLDEAMDRAEKAEQERDEWKDSAIKAMADLERAEQPRPLTPNMITDEMVERARNAPSFDGRLSPTPRLVREMLTAALTEPPAHPEGAEDLAPIVDEMLEAYWRGDLNGADAPGFLAEHGVRVVTEEQP